MTLYERTVAIFGSRHQQIKAIEEMGELTVELARSLNGDHREALVRCEIADVMILMHQLCVIFGESEMQEVLSEKRRNLEQLLEASSIS